MTSYGSGTAPRCARVPLRWQNQPVDTPNDPFGARAPLPGHPDLGYYRLTALDEQGVASTARLPYTVRVLLEMLLRNAGGVHVSEADVRALANWPAPAPDDVSVPFLPARVILQDFTGVPAVVDLAAMRAAVARAGRDAERVDPLVPADLVIDHSRPGRLLRHRASPTPATSSGSTSATASATRCCAGRSRRSTASASCRPAWASSTRSTSSTSAASCSCARTRRARSRCRTRSSAPTRTRR